MPDSQEPQNQRVNDANLAAHLIFAGASSKPEGERDGFLDEVCGDRSELRDQIDNVLESEANEAAAAIGDYEVQRPLGRGAMASVMPPLTATTSQVASSSAPSAMRPSKEPAPSIGLAALSLVRLAPAAR